LQGVEKYGLSYSTHYKEISREKYGQTAISVFEQAMVVETALVGGG
jgi:hypothetical protein